MWLKSIEIKKVTIEKIDQLHEIGKRTYVETFSSENRDENMKEYLESGCSTEKLKLNWPTKTLNSILPY